MSGRLPTVLLVAFAAGCVTPVIPIPPPDPQGTVDVGKAEVTIWGNPSSAHAESMVYLYNERSGQGHITLSGADGSFRFQPLPVADGDRLDIWASRFTEDSPSSILCRVVDFARGDIARQCY